MLGGWERKEEGKKRRLDLGEIGPEPSVLAKSALGWGIRLQTSRTAFQPQILCDLLSSSAQCEGRVSKPAKCFHYALFSTGISNETVNHSLTNYQQN